MPTRNKYAKRKPSTEKNTSGQRRMTKEATERLKALEGQLRADAKERDNDGR